MTNPSLHTFTDEEIEQYIVTTGAGCVLELAKDVQRARADVGRLRAEFAEMAATARREALEEAARECEGLGKTTTTGSIVGGVCDRVAAKIRELAKKEAP